MSQVSHARQAFLSCCHARSICHKRDNCIFASLPICCTFCRSTKPRYFCNGGTLHPSFGRASTFVSFSLLQMIVVRCSWCLLAEEMPRSIIFVPLVRLQKRPPDLLNIVREFRFELSDFISYFAQLFYHLLMLVLNLFLIHVNTKDP